MYSKQSAKEDNSIGDLYTTRIVKETGKFYQQKYRSA